ncbi:MAG: HupE/UreJ family protein, partial [Vicinamibacterales bacterium]
APSPRHRWALAFGFGLVHGFGFSFALRETLQFAGDHLLLSLLSFNLGVEFGQLLVLLALVPALALLFRRVPERAGTVVLALLIGHTAWHWMLERGDALMQYTFTWPEPSLPVLLAAVRWLTLLVLIGGAAWLVFGVLPALAAGRGVPADSLGRGRGSSKPETHT